MIFDKEKIDSIISYINNDTLLRDKYEKIFELDRYDCVICKLDEFREYNFKQKLYFYSAKLAELIFESFIDESISGDLKIQLKIFDVFIYIFNTILNKSIVENEKIITTFNDLGIDAEKCSIISYNQDALFRHLAYLFYDRTNDKKQNIEYLIKHMIELNNSDDYEKRYKYILFCAMKNCNKSFYENRLKFYEKQYRTYSQHIIQLRRGVKFLRGVFHDKDEIKRYIAEHKLESKTQAINDIEEEINKLKTIRNDLIKEMKELDTIKIKECRQELQILDNLTQEKFEEMMGHI